MAAMTQASVRKRPRQDHTQGGDTLGEDADAVAPLRDAAAKVPLPRNSRTTHMMTRMMV